MKKFFYIILLSVLSTASFEAMYAAQAADCHAIMQEEKLDEELSAIQALPSPLPITPERKAQLDRILARQQKQIQELSGVPPVQADAYELKNTSLEIVANILYEQMVITTALSLPVAYNHHDFDFYHYSQFSIDVLKQVEKAKVMRRRFHKLDPFRLKIDKEILAQRFMRTFNKRKGRFPKKKKELADINSSVENYYACVNHRYREYSNFFTLLQLIENHIQGREVLTITQLAALAYEQIVYLSMTFGLVFPELPKSLANSLVKNTPTRELVLTDVELLLNISTKIFDKIKRMSHDFGIPFYCKRYRRHYKSVVIDFFGKGKASRDVRGFIHHFAHALDRDEKLSHDDHAVVVSGALEINHDLGSGENHVLLMALNEESVEIQEAIHASFIQEDQILVGPRKNMKPQTLIYNRNRISKAKFIGLASLGFAAFAAGLVGYTFL